MSKKKKNDMFEYEKQWQLFKGNEYMFHLLHKMRPKVSCTCPQSYLDFLKMPKNTMLGVVKEHDLMLQNVRLKRKLHKIQISKSTINSYIESYPTIQQMQSHLKNSQKTVSKDLERNHILWENSNMFRRITESKSFFSLMKIKSNSNTARQQNSSTNRKDKKKSSLCDFRSTSTTTLNVKRQTIESYRDNHTQNISLRENSSGQSYFDYNELNKELIRKDRLSLWLHKKNIYIPNYGLVAIKVNYQFNKLTLVIESFSTTATDTHLIVVTDYSSLSRIPFLFKSFDNLLFSIKYDKANVFSLKKSISGFKYSTDVLTKEKKQQINTRNMPLPCEKINSKTIS